MCNCNQINDNHLLPHNCVNEKNNFQLKFANFVSSGSSVSFHISTDGSHRRPGFAAKVKMMMKMKMMMMMTMMTILKAA